MAASSKLRPRRRSLYKLRTCQFDPELPFLVGRGMEAMPQEAVIPRSSERVRSTEATLDLFVRGSNDVPPDTRPTGLSRQAM